MFSIAGVSGIPIAISRGAVATGNRERNCTYTINRLLLRSRRKTEQKVNEQI
jgi:hypothetical protein